jgi:membrane protein
MENKTKTQKLINFFQEDIWQLKWNHLPVWKRILLRQLRMLVTVVHEFRRDDVYLRASALTFYSLLSIVPVFALAFGIAKGFGLEATLKKQVIETATGQEVVLNQILKFASLMVENTQGGLVAGVGLVFLFWTVMKLLSNIELAFNSIWGIKKSRTLTRKLSDYLSIMLITPILFIISGSLSIFISKYLATLVDQDTSLSMIGPTLLSLMKISPYVLIWLAFTLIYIVMPNQNVKFKSSFVAGVIAGSGYIFLQFIFIKFQVGVASANAVYGSFAALPLFLIWLNISWLVILIGAEISYAHQNVDKYYLQNNVAKISTQMQRKVSLLITHYFVQQFINEGKPQSVIQVSEALHIPIPITELSMKRLQEAHILSEIQSDEDDENYYQPAQDPDRLTVSYIIQQLDKLGEHKLHLIDTDATKKVADILSTFDIAVETNDENQSLKGI